MLFNPLQVQKELDNLGSVLALLVIAEAIDEAVHEFNFKPIVKVADILLSPLVD